MSDAVELAKQLIRRFAEGAYDDVVGSFDDGMRQMVPQATLERSWAQVLSEAGRFVKVKEAELQEGEEGLRLVRLLCEFELGELVANVALDPEGQISGLHFHAPRI